MIFWFGVTVLVLWMAVVSFLVYCLYLKCIGAL